MPTLILLIKVRSNAPVTTGDNNTPRSVVTDRIPVVRLEKNIPLLPSGQAEVWRASYNQDVEEYHSAPSNKNARPILKNSESTSAAGRGQKVSQNQAQQFGSRQLGDESRQKEQGFSNENTHSERVHREGRDVQSEDVQQADFVRASSSRREDCDDRQTRFETCYEDDWEDEDEYFNEKEAVDRIRRAGPSKTSGGKSNSEVRNRGKKSAKRSLDNSPRGEKRKSRDKNDSEGSRRPKKRSKRHKRSRSRRRRSSSSSSSSSDSEEDKYEDAKEGGALPIGGKTALEGARKDAYYIKRYPSWAAANLSDLSVDRAALRNKAQVSLVLVSVRGNGVFYVLG